MRWEKALLSLCADATQVLKLLLKTANQCHGCNTVVGERAQHTEAQETMINNTLTTFTTTLPTTNPDTPDGMIPTSFGFISFICRISYVYMVSV